MMKVTLVMSIAGFLVTAVVYLSHATEAQDVKKGPDAPARVTSTSVTIYDKDPTHLWNRLHATIFVRTMDDGQTTGHDTVDALLWPETSEHLLSGASHKNVNRILDEFLKGRGEKVITEPLPRALLQHDLWAVYDWAATRSEVAPAASRILRVRLAKAIQRLALTTDQIKRLPDNYAKAVTSDTWPRAFDPKGSGAAFVPPTLFDEDGPWICISGQKEMPNSMVHLTYFRGRSAFLAFMKLPGGREATLAYLEELNKASEAHGVFKGFERFDEKDNGLPALPIGTRVALVRQMMLIDQTGRIVPSPIVQTVRLRVYLPESRTEQNKDAKQEVHKFKITRSALLGGKAGGMKPIGLAEMERLALTHTREELRGTHVELHRCASCHGWLSHNKRIGSVFSFNQGFLSSMQNINLGQKSYPFSFENRARLYPIKIDDELNRTVQWKKSRNDWSMLRGTMDTLLKEE